jgi:hypothetical protein
MTFWLVAAIVEWQWSGSLVCIKVIASRPSQARCDLASTIRHLRPARGEKVQAQVHALWA